MLRFASLRALGVTLALSAGLTLASAASATAYSYDFTKVKGTLTGTQTFTMTGSDGSTLNVKATAWKATPDYFFIWPTGKDSVTSSTLAAWQGYGMGVVSSGDSTNDGTHQIDNTSGGSDIVMLQFDKDVSLSAITRNVYSISGTTCCDSDASIYADTSRTYGTNVTSKTNLDLSSYTLTESAFTTVAGGASASTTSLTSTALGSSSASVWLIGAAFGQSNDGFKLAGLTVNTATAAVPEPASWAMMIGGFGMVGAGMRRRRQVLAAA